MTILALSTPTVFCGDVQLKAGIGFTATYGTSIAANSGFTVPWVQGLMIYALGASSNTVTLTFVGTGGTSNCVTSSLAATVPYLFGPVSNSFQAATTGLVSVNITGVVAGMYVTGLLLPTTGPIHGPMDMLLQSAEY